jgi:acetyl esterase/lipase
MYHVAIHQNIPYRSSDDPVWSDLWSDSHRLDVYVPVSESKGSESKGSESSETVKNQSYPILFYIHGGAWCLGDRATEKNQEIATEMALRGFVTVVPSYRLSFPSLNSGTSRRELTDPGTYLPLFQVVSMLGIALSKRSVEKWTWMILLVMFTILIWMDHEHSFYIRTHQHPCHVEDCVAALTWFKQNAARYRGRVDSIHVMGHSAGAHLASLMLVHPDYSSIYSNCCIQSVCLISGVYDAELFLQHATTRSFARYVFGHESVSGAFPLTYIRPESVNTQREFPVSVNSQRESPVSRGSVNSHCEFSVSRGSVNSHCEFSVSRGSVNSQREFSGRYLDHGVRWLVMHGEYEYGLECHSKRLIECLHAVSARVESIVWSDVDHFSIIDQWSTFRYPIADYIERFIRNDCDRDCKQVHT